jgi:TonB family protein
MNYMMHFNNLISFFAGGALALSCPWDLRTGDEDFGGAEPIAPEKWVTSGDYPESAIAFTHSGLVVVQFTITKEGRAQDCKIKKSGGHERIDEVSCKLVVRRARFVPAKDSQSQPRSTSGYISFYFSPE